MTDVYFQGYGRWIIVTPHPDDTNPLPIKSNSFKGAAFHSGKTVFSVIDTKQLVEGVFSLCDEDEKRYRHKKSFDGISCLRPSIHSDDDFLIWTEQRGRCEPYEKCLEATFDIDLNRPMALSIAEPDTKPKTPAKKTDDDPDKTLSNLFDSVPVAALEKTFPANGQWAGWAEKAKSNGLIVARPERAMFNPYLAGKWFVKKGQHGWDDARLMRVLANNLPARSLDEKHQLTGELN